MASLASSSAPVAEGPVHKGWLFKEGHDLRATLGMGDWKNRFFVLYYTEEWKEYVLLYYKQEDNFERTESQGTINLAGATVTQAAKSPTGFFQFSVTTSKGKKYPIRSKTSAERAEWIERIGLAINPPPAAPGGGGAAAAAPRPFAASSTAATASFSGGPPPTTGSGKVIAVTDFELKAVVGKGAFGKVFLVEKKDGDMVGLPLAMKVLDKQVIADKGQVTHTMSERDILRDVQHPFLVRMHFAFQTERKLYMVTDYYPGGNLYAHVQRAKRSGGFDEVRARFYAAELCLALEHLHKNHVVYRDMKLENILMDMEGHIVLTDFGLSKDKLADVNEVSITTFCGTVEYMAPELVRGQKYNVAVDW